MRKSQTAIFYSVDHLPNRSKTPYRLRFKNLKGIGIEKEGEFAKKPYFANEAAAKFHAQRLLEEQIYSGTKSRQLDESLKTSLLREAARIVEGGGDPLLAMKEGFDLISSWGKLGDKRIGSFWEDYFNRKVDSGNWSAREITRQKTFHREVQNTFMQAKVKSFLKPTDGRKKIEFCIKAYRNQNRNATNTIKTLQSNMRAFLGYLAGQVEQLTPVMVKDLFDSRYLLIPTGTRPEADNVAVSVDQAVYLLKYMRDKGHPAWIVFKLFIGARTLLLQQWKWSVVDWHSESIRIPRDLTKTKKSDINFPIADVPNLKSWLQWAWELDGKPSPDQPICKASQPTITNKIKEAMNADKGLFQKDKRKKINPSRQFRNFLRSAFITYGVEVLGVGKVMKIAEDRYNLDKYLTSDTQVGPTSESERYFKLQPKDLD